MSVELDHVCMFKHYYDVSCLQTGASLVVQLVKDLPDMEDTLV